MERIEPAVADELARLRRREVAQLNGITEDELERRRAGAEVRCGGEGEVDLECAREKEHAIDPRVAHDVHGVERVLLLAHVLGEVVER